MQITFNAYAKLNLTLDVTEKRPDNYHNIVSVFQSVGLYDKLKISSDAEKTTVKSNIPLPKNNTCFLATELFFEKAQIRDAVSVEIEKNIPVCAGLGGGSADAAAILRVLNYMYSQPLSENDMLEIAAKIGADVPFCLYGGTAKVSGIGEQIKSVAPLCDCEFIIVKNAEKPSTAQLYRSLDDADDLRHPNTDAFLAALKSGKLDKIAENCGNVFENVWGDKIQSVKFDLTKSGAIGVCLSGSGPAVFGIFEKAKANTAYAALKEKYKHIFRCEPVKHGYSIENIE